MRRLHQRLLSLLAALLIVGIGATAAYYAQIGARKIPIREYFPKEYTAAVWDWHNPTTRSKGEIADLGQFLYLHQIDTLYVDISVYADLLQQPDPEFEERLIQGLRNHVNGLRGYEVQVVAMAGNTEWSKPQYRHIPLAIQQFVYRYNRNHPNERLAGLEFDIESYNQNGFADSSNTEKSIVLIELLDTVQEVVNAHDPYLRDSGDQRFEIGFAVPYWFDNQNGNIPSVTWQGKTGPTIFHIVDTLNLLPKSNIVVMAYRNAAAGSDGVLFHSRTEIEYVQARAPRVKVLVGQEVTEVEPEKITYYGQTPAELSSEVRAITDTFGPTGAYGGIAINDLAGLRELDANE